MKRKLKEKKNIKKSTQNVEEINKVSNEDGIINNNKQFNYNTM